MGNVSIERALCDLGSRMSLMPLSMCKKLDLGEMRPATVTLQLADHSLKYPRGVLEDVLIKVGDLHVSVDLVILEMEKDTHTPIILRRPFLAIVGCRIDEKNRKLSFDVGNDHVEFNSFKASKFPSISDECHRSDMIDNLLKEEATDYVSNFHLRNVS